MSGRLDGGQARRRGDHQPIAGRHRPIKGNARPRRADMMAMAATMMMRQAIIRVTGLQVAMHIAAPIDRLVSSSTQPKASVACASVPIPMERRIMNAAKKDSKPRMAFA
ncbi:MAG: hypothetical protein U5M50_07160 [Sphingobium sp.]|nr:hypothetical protein [Sphingobium sp.]